MCAVMAIVIGYAVTLFFYFVGEPLVSPSLFLARQLVSDRGGDSLLFAFTVINTLILFSCRVRCALADDEVSTVILRSTMPY